MQTSELRSRFDTSFHKLMAHTPPDFQKKWDGKIVWHDNKLYPSIDVAIIQGLPPTAKGVYITLLNKLSRGSI